MASVTAEVTRVIWVSIKGEGGNYPRLPHDDGLCHRFRKWTCENNIDPAIIAGNGGPGFHNAAYWPEDMERIVEWLEANGVDVSEIVKELPRGEAG